MGLHHEEEEVDGAVVGRLTQGVLVPMWVQMSDEGLHAVL